jgi:formiminotetrahydrofolate cyclodeaminase
MDAEQRASEAAPLRDWLDRLSQDDGSPGGGSASGVLLAIGAALLEMVLRYSDPDDDSGIRSRAGSLRADALQHARTDATASATLGAALALSTDDPAREGQVRSAGADAARTSAQLGDTGIELVTVLEQTAELTIPAVRADLGVAAEALAAGLGGALINLRADLKLMERHDGDVPEELTRAAGRMDEARRSAASRAAEIREG